MKGEITHLALLGQQSSVLLASAECVRCAGRDTSLSTSGPAGPVSTSPDALRARVSAAHAHSSQMAHVSGRVSIPWTLVSSAVRRGPGACGEDRRMWDGRGETVATGSIMLRS
ncbi:unnamed protein product [Rangifer tarandus platyrhynchus]|uniref:Uncharacterized protein n=2 Tax=Rangifer tarandus platyrhynchus TaxID=3082113 RepID=A0ABN8ZM24_RANTA|nr:unnamed protein product [Rangifer tarandus platyrhynchus]CAI9708344.1 unnamed protein product [Rangifer tarandus platyrhynchus]